MLNWHYNTGMVRLVIMTAPLICPTTRWFSFCLPIIDNSHETLSTCPISDTLPSWTTKRGRAETELYVQGRDNYNTTERKGRAGSIAGCNLIKNPRGDRHVLPPQLLSLPKLAVFDSERKVLKFLYKSSMRIIRKSIKCKEKQVKSCHLPVADRHNY